MEFKNKTLNDITEFIIKFQDKIRNLRIDNSPRISFIDLETEAVKLNIEIKADGKIIFSFDDGWSYFTGNPNDREFTDVKQAKIYLKEIFERKLKRHLVIEYKGKKHEGYISLESINPHRRMGVERIFNINILTKDGEELPVAKISEYPLGSYSFVEKVNGVNFSEKEVKDFLEDNQDMDQGEEAYEPFLG